VIQWGQGSIVDPDFFRNAQEAYENTILAIRLAEHKDVQLPVMVCQDGFITSHCIQNVNIFEDSEVKKFIGQREPVKALLNINDPVTMGPLQLQDYYFETKRQQEDAMQKAKSLYIEIGKELTKLQEKLMSI